MTIQPDQMCFGLTEDLDQQSFSCFLQLSGDKHFADILAKRVTSAEILTHVDSFTMLLRKYLTENEYHSIFLQDDTHNHPEPRED
jgi:hypothetical protein